MPFDAAHAHDPPSPTPAAEPPLSRRLVVADHALTIFAESPPLIDAVLADVRAARTRVWVETYIFVNDRAGQAIAQALAERATAGLDVRVLYDAIGSSGTPAAFFRTMETAGVRVHAFHSLWEALWRFSFFRVLNRRNHRKLIVIDDRIAYFGGMNLIDPGRDVSGGRKERRLESLGWRDIHLRLCGPRQAEIAESFERSWLRAQQLPTTLRPRPYRRAKLAEGEESMQFFDCGPGPDCTRASRVFSQILRRARRRLALSMAYFLPVGRVLRDLLKAHRRGVFIRLVVPGESDVPLVQSASRHLYTRLLRRRFHIFERQRNMLHSKVVVADDAWSITGSCNLDARSLRINFEFLAVIHSRILARALSEIIQYEVARSRRMTVQECMQWSRWQRLLNRLAWALRWWL
jgi:cardiolipin synthase A/B